MDNKKNVRGVPRLALLLLSFVLACALWLIVMIELDPTSTAIIDNIPLTFVNEEAFLARNLVILEGRDETVSLQFSGRRSILAGLNNENIIAQADLRYISTEGVTPVMYQAVLPAEAEGKVVLFGGTTTTQTVNLTVDRLIPVNLPVILASEGSIQEGYMMEEPIIEPAAVDVWAPSTLADQIGSAEVTLRRELFTTTVEHEILPVVLLDAERNVLDLPYTTLEQPEVSVTVPIVMTKTLPLSVNFSLPEWIPAENVNYTVEPEAVMVSGGADALGTLNNIELGNLDLTQVPLGESVHTFPITIPNGVKYLTGTTEATVTLNLTGLREQTFETSSITILNAAPPEGYEVTAITQRAVVTLRGAAAAIGRVDASNIHVVCDLSGQTLTPGLLNWTAEVRVPYFQSEVGVVGTVSVTLGVTPAANPAMAQGPYPAGAAY